MGSAANAWSERAAGVAVAAVALLAFFGGWLWTARGLPEFVLPGPMAVLRAVAAFGSDTVLISHAAISFVRVAAAVLIALLIAIVLAALHRASPWSRTIIEARILTLLNSFPSVGWAILGVLWFDVSSFTVVFIQVMIVLPFCLINLIEGLRQLDTELMELGRSLTRTRARLVTKLMVPLVMPFAIAGLRIAYGIAWKVALVSELFGATSGLGYLLQQAQTTSNAAMVFACCLVIVLLFGAVDFLLLRPLSARYSVNRGGNR